MRPRFGPPRTAFLFTGQGAQHPGMAVDHAAFARLCAVADEALGESLAEAIATDRVHDTAIANPAGVVVQLALVHWWRDHGVEADIALGHSQGEIAAAAWAGACSEEEAVRLAVRRGQLMASLPVRGAMAAVFAPEARVRRWLHPEAEIAVVNAPDNTVIAGPEHAVADTLAVAGEGRRLHIDQASHNHLVDPILDAWEAACARVAWRVPERPLLSNVTGAMHVEAPGPAYWRAHLRHPVRFLDGLTVLRDERIECFVELGPHPVLVRIAQGMLGNGAFLPSQHRDDPHAADHALAELRRRGWPT